MNPGGHRGIAAMLMLLALVLSAMALLPARAQAANGEITGLVSQCGSGTFFIAGAKVTLSDANGVLPSLSTTTDGAGVYVFTPSAAANYTLSVSKAGYYSNNTPQAPQSSPFRYDGSTVVQANVCLDAQPASTGAVTFTVVNGAVPSQKIGSATLSIYNPARLPTPWSALIVTNTTNSTTGVAIEPLWSGSFEVRVSAGGYQPFIRTMTLTPPQSVTIDMTAAVSVVGHAHDATTNSFVSTGLTGWLYSPSAPKYNGTKVIPATVNGSLFSFSAPAGTYRMIVDAKGYAAYDQPITIGAGTTLQDVFLSPSLHDIAQTTVLFGMRDWNNFTVWRNLTLNPDSTLAGLGPAGLRDLRQQINYTLGTGAGDGTISAGDFAAFQAWLAKNGPAYVTTDNFLTLNRQAYNSTMTSFTVSVSNTLLTPGERVWINTSATYHLKSTAWIRYGQPKYFLNMTVFPDSNVTNYHDEVYIVQLPVFYEMVSSQMTGAITTTGYTRITVDPGLNGQAIQMVLEQSLTGIARAKVIGPSGKFYVADVTYQHYQAYVANNTNISFSAAETSNPPSNDATRDNFTWRFLGNVSVPNPPNNIRWGIQPSFSFPEAGPYIVNLTAIGAGGNVSYRNIDIWVDGSPPIPAFRTNVTGSGSAVGLHIQYDQGAVIRFDGGLSTDVAYPGKAGVIPNSGYAWDFNGDHITDAVGRVANGTFSKPGVFTVNLTVTDSVGNKAANVSLTITVNDTEAPAPGWAVLDPANEYAPVSVETEMRNYTFNASKTTDNYDKLSALNFTWTIPGPLIGQNGTTRKMYGMNITFGWSEWNLSYPVKLVVRDTGFGSNKPNNGTLTQNVSVQIDHALHPYLVIDQRSVKLDNANPETGQTVTVTLNVTNTAGWGTASHLLVKVSEDDSALAPTWSATDANGTALSTIAAGQKAVFRISFSVIGQGNKTLTITVSDAKMPYTLTGNVAKQTIVVQQPGWVNYAIIGSVAAVFVVVIFAMYYRRKVKAGDWQPRFRRTRGGKEEGGREKPRREKEAKEEKKRL